MLYPAPRLSNSGSPALRAANYLAAQDHSQCCQAWGSAPPPAKSSGGLAARLLHDDTPDLTDRAAGSLLLLYGQQLSRIATLTTSQVANRGDNVFIRFGDHDVSVPQPLGVILTELIRAGRTHTGTGSPPTTPWLFPGGLPGQPITPGRLGGRLRALGVHAMAGRR